jgi:regulator of protease activity HflC (stomatin/prohibitin superfamily)
MSLMAVIYPVILVLAVAIVASAVRVMREYQRAVVFTFGRFSGVKGPGLILLVPIVQQMVRVDLRTVVLDVPSQDVISRDNVSVKVNAVVYFRVMDADKAVIVIENFLQATSQLAQTTLRSVLGKHMLDEMLAERDQLNADIQEILDRQTEAWGVKVTNVEIKQVDLDHSMVRAIARQAEAGAHPPRQGHQRRGRAAGGGETGRGRADSCQEPRGHAATISRHPERDRQRAKLDDRVPFPARRCEGVQQNGRRPAAMSARQ